MDLLPGAVQPKGHVSFQAGRGWNVRWQAASQAQNPVKSPRHEFLDFLGVSEPSRNPSRASDLIAATHSRM